MAVRERFSSRWTMLIVMLSMAVGTGNIWRFPRIAAQNGGGEFLIAWVVFLFFWSIPLILVELGAGRKTRGGPIKAFVVLLGPRWAWMGAFVALVATAIMFYYSVVAGWTLRYVLGSLSGELPGERPGAFWVAFTESWWPALTHAVALGGACLVVARGVASIEKLARILMPVLLLLVLILAVRAAFLPGASAGLAYLFTVDWHNLARSELWLHALTQNAWDTGAGWGLALCYAAYLREREDTALNGFILPTANNVISLLAGVMVLCTVFSVVPALVANLSQDPDALAAFPELAKSVAAGQPISPDLLQSTIFGAGNEGMTFVWMPYLFARIPMGRLLMLLFFLALAFAAFTSLVAMVELAARVLVDTGIPRRKAIYWIGIVGFALGLPSALSLRVLHNQDWVWGMALILSGLFLAIGAVGSGIRRFREEQLCHAHSDIRVGRWWDLLVSVVVPIEALVLIGWWLYEARGWNPEAWLTPFAEANVGTVLLQWGVALALLLAMNARLARGLGGPEAGVDP